MKVKLCHTGACCPTVDVQEEQTLLSDDYGGSVKLTAEEWQILKDKVAAGEI